VREPPFQHHPDPRFLYLTTATGGARRHRLRDRGAQGIIIVDRRRPAPGRRRLLTPAARHGRARRPKTVAPETPRSASTRSSAHPVELRRAARKAVASSSYPAPQRVPAEHTQAGRQKRRAPNRRDPGHAPGRARGASGYSPTWRRRAREDPPDRPRRAAELDEILDDPSLSTAPATGALRIRIRARSPRRGSGYVSRRVSRARGRHGSRALPARRAREPRDDEPRIPRWSTPLLAQPPC